MPIMIVRIGAKVRQAVARVVLPAAGLFALITIGVVLSHLEVVDEGQTCAVTRWGKQIGEAGPGFHVRRLGESLHCFNTRLTTYEAGNAVNADYTDGVVKGPTADGQEIELSYRVSFFIPQENVGRVYREVAQDMNEVNLRVVEFYTRPKVRQIAQEYTAGQLYGGVAAPEGQNQSLAQSAQVKLSEVEQRMFDTLKPLFESNGVSLVDFELGKPEFSPEYVKAIQARQLAEENVQIQRNNAMAAREEADRTANLAAGKARADVALAEAEATAIAVKGAAVRENPEVLQLELIETLPGANVIYLPNDGITQVMGVGGQPIATPRP
jgi:regulator of protease activity HflC (stomatin/prohibitin superfamily)